MVASKSKSKKKDDPDRLEGLAATGRAFGVTGRTVSGWINKGCPFVEEGDQKKRKPWVFSKKSLLKWTKVNLGAQSPLSARNASGIDPEDDEIDIGSQVLQLKLRRETAETVTAEAKAAKEIGALIESASAIEEFSRAMMAFKTAIAGLGSRLADVLAPEMGPHQVKEKIDEATREALEEMAAYEPEEDGE